jgi:hypothetical protein
MSFFASSLILLALSYDFELLYLERRSRMTWMNLEDNLPKRVRIQKMIMSKPPQRVIDESRSVKYTDDDVLLGRGGFTNTHPGNIRFHEKALELRQLYESSDKEQKFEISKLLLGSVTDKGNRFLERGDDGLWHEVVGFGARKKASQALRERIKGSRR